MAGLLWIWQRTFRFNTGERISVRLSCSKAEQAPCCAIHAICVGTAVISDSSGESLHNLTQFRLSEQSWCQGIDAQPSVSGFQQLEINTVSSLQVHVVKSESTETEA